ncbi:MAG: exopolyphosphatase [Flavobacteriales bacterium]|nr:exopolyphosphatase [Flavobacteriales bacterium]
MKFAAIDIGSNAIRLLIEEVHQGENGFVIEKVSLTRVPVRLGDDVFVKGKIPKGKIEQLIKTMKAFWYLMDVHGVEYFMACATSALRDASNRDEVVSKVKKEANIPVLVLSGKEEADLIFGNFSTQKLSKTGNYLYIDVGGGSTEITLISKGKRIKSKSFNIGTVRALYGKVKDSEWKRAELFVKNTKPAHTSVLAMGTGGNINAIHKMAGKKPNEVLTLADIAKQCKLISGYSYEERISQLRLKPDRADVIVPAAEIYLRLMKVARINRMLVPKIGLSDGMILDLFTQWESGKIRQPGR